MVISFLVITFVVSLISCIFAMPEIGGAMSRTMHSCLPGRVAQKRQASAAETPPETTESMFSLSECGQIAHVTHDTSDIPQKLRVRDEDGDAVISVNGRDVGRAHGAAQRVGALEIAKYGQKPAAEASKSDA